MIKIRFSILLCIVLGSVAKGEQIQKEIECLDKIEYLVMPDAFSGGDFKISEGKVFWDENKKSEKLPDNNSPASKKYNGDGLYIMGAPAVVLERSMLDIGNMPGTDPGISRGAKMGGDVVVVSNSRVLTQRENAISCYRVFLKMGDHLKIVVSFDLKDNIYNEYLAGVFPIDDKIVAIISASSRHPFINTLYLIDIKQGNVVGVKGFGKIQYVPENQSFRIAAQVPNSKNAEDVIKDNVNNQVTIPLYKNGGVSEEFLSDLNSVIINK